MKKFAKLIWSFQVKEFNDTSKKFVKEAKKLGEEKDKSGHVSQLI